MKKAVASIGCVRPSCTIWSCASMVEILRGWSWEAPAHVRRDPADDREHAHAAVRQLRLAELVDGERVGDAQGVEGLLIAHPACQRGRVV